MILKMTNKSKNFYKIMGKFFGSRIVETKTNDRIYDDNQKDWYILFDNEVPVAFISIVSDVIKNVYSINNDFLIKLFQYVSKKVNVKDSIVTKTYLDVYKTCGFIVSDDNYKNFVKIRSDENG